MQNVVDLDGAARVFAIQKDTARLPLLVAWDFAAAFPSVSHDWLFRVLKHMRIPDGLMNVIRAIYHCNLAWGSIRGCLSPLFVAMSGILQGCPLSGLLFAWIMNPFLEAMKAMIDDKGLAMTRA